MENLDMTSPQSFVRKTILLEDFKGHTLKSNHQSMPLCYLRFCDVDQKVTIVTVLITDEKKLKDIDCYRLVRVVNIGKNSFTAEVVGKNVEFCKVEIDSLVRRKLQSSKPGIPVKRSL